MKLPIIFAMATAIFWGLYGPALGVARQSDPSSSPFKPYLFIGAAYLVWALIGGVFGMMWRQDSFDISSSSAVWGFLAGSLGAFGALTLTLAMYTGGGKMPHVVMPVVFGGAVTVAAFVSVLTAHDGAKASPLLWVGIIGMFVCIVLVATNTPHAAPKPSTSPSAAATGAAHAPTAEASESKPHSS